MFKTILVPLDGTKSAEGALPIAARIARNSGATIVLAHVVSFLSEYGPTMTAVNQSMAEASVKADLAETTIYLDRVASSTQLADISVISPHTLVLSESGLVFFRRLRLPVPARLSSADLPVNTGGGNLAAYTPFACPDFRPGCPR